MPSFIYRTLDVSKSLSATTRGSFKHTPGDGQTSTYGYFSVCLWDCFFALTKCVVLSGYTRWCTAYFNRQSKGDSGFCYRTLLMIGWAHDCSKCDGRRSSFFSVTDLLLHGWRIRTVGYSRSCQNMGAIQSGRDRRHIQFPRFIRTVWRLEFVSCAGGNCA